LKEKVELTDGQKSASETVSEMRQKRRRNRTETTEGTQHNWRKEWKAGHSTWQKRRGVVLTAPDPYSGGSSFESGSRDRLFLYFSWFSSV